MSEFAIWKMRRETKEGFEAIAARYGITQQRLADIILDIVNERLKENSVLEIDSLAHSPEEVQQSVVD